MISEEYTMPYWAHSKTTGFMRLPEVLSLIPVCKSFIWDAVKKGSFPEPIKLSPRVTVWKAEDIHNYITAKTKGESANA